MNQHLKNIFHLGIKELIELLRDRCMLVLIVYAFSLAVYTTAMGTPDPVYHAPIAVVDEDQTQLSQRIADAFLPPLFETPRRITLAEVDPLLDAGECTFVLVIPAHYQQDVLSGKHPELQLNVDATRMTQAFVGGGYIQQIVEGEISKFINRSSESSSLIQLDLRDRFNPNLVPQWFGGVNQMVNNVTMLAIVLIGAALIRERERGTLEHLLVMPVCPFEIMCAKIWSMMLAVAIAAFFSVFVVLHIGMEMPIDGSLALFMVGVCLHLFAVTSMGIFLACIAENMPQLGMLFILVLMPMSMLSGGQTPRESMPPWVQYIMEAAPTTHFVKFSQQLLYRGAGIDVVWKPYLWLFVIGAVLFVLSLFRFHRTATR